MEVEIDHGRIIASEPARLPEAGKGLLTILPVNPDKTATRSKLAPLQCLEKLQRHLQLDDRKVEEWMATVREGRR